MAVNADYARGHLPFAALLSDNMQMRDKRHFIREWRKAKGLTQMQLAERAEVTQAMVSRVENGSPYDEEFLERVAVALNVTPADLLTRKDGRRPKGRAGILAWR